MTPKANYIVEKGRNGFVFVDAFKTAPALHVTKDGNSKTGKAVGSYNFSPEQSCNHNCECFSEKKCYACGGFYAYGSNQYGYAENLSFFLHSDNETFCTAFCDTLKKNGNKKFRYFTCGDILNSRFFACMIENARRMPNVKFWSYTKKYNIVNKWCDENGVENFPKNLKIIFSHWMNDDGSYFPMENPYNFPTSEFIPYGREDLLEKVTHVCPCSDPNVLATCDDCDRPCYELEFGESMGLCEHSTAATKARDKAVKAAHNALKAVKNAVKKATKKA